MHLSAALTALALLILGTAVPSLSATTNCRQCKPRVSISGVISDDKLGAFMTAATQKITGGDSYTWIAQPTARSNWTGTADFPRLCGKSNWVDHIWHFSTFPEGQTTLQVTGSCGKNVRCNGGSSCQKSEIM